MLAYVVAGVTAIGTGVIVLNRYLTLPDRVEAAEKENQQQNKILDRLTTLQELYAQQRSVPSTPPSSSTPPVPITTRPRVWKAQTSDGSWYCEDKTSWWWPNQDGSC